MESAHRRWVADADLKHIEHTHDLDERQITRRLDKFLLSYAGLLLLVSSMDRVNIGNAKVAGLGSDLKLKPYEYNLALSTFFIGYIISEVPANVILKAWRPSLWLGLLMALWGAVTMATAAVKDGPGLITARFFLGFFESGLYPGLLYVLSLWYTQKQLAVRFAWFYSLGTIAGTIGSFAAYGITHMDGMLALHGWQWLFLIEGLLTIILGFSTMLYIPDTPATAWFLAPRHRDVLVERLRDTSTTKPSAETTSWAAMAAITTDPKAYLLALIAIFNSTSTFAISLFLPSIVKGMGFDSTISQALSAPPYFIGCIALIINGWHSDRTMERGYHIALPMYIAMTMYAALVWVRNPAAQYALITLAATAVYCHVPAFLTWITSTFPEHTKRAIALAFVLMFNNSGAIIASQVYRDEDAPGYAPGHAVCAVTAFLGGTLTLCMRWYLACENKRTRMTEMLSSTTEEKLGEEGGTFGYHYTL